MTKKKTPSTEAVELARWCSAIAEFMAQLGPHTELDNEMKSAIQRCLERDDLKGLKTMSRDLVEWSSALNDAQRLSLDDELIQKFGAGLDNALAVQLDQLRGIRKRGVVRNDQEYRVVMSRVEAIYDQQEQADEVSELNTLLAAYHHQPDAT